VMTLMTVTRMTIKTDNDDTNCFILQKAEKRKLRFEQKLAGHRLRRKKRKEDRRERKEETKPPRS